MDENDAFESDRLHSFKLNRCAFFRFSNANIDIKLQKTVCVQEE